MTVQQIRLCLPSDEAFHDFVARSLDGPEKRRLSKGVHRIDGGSLVEQILYQTQVPVIRGLMQRRSVLVVLEIDLRTLLRQQLHTRLMIFPRGLPECRSKERLFAIVQI